MRSQSGFTLIEMVAVIVILAIMAATAMPRFVNLSGEARMAAVAGISSALSSAAKLAKSKWTVATGSSAVPSVFVRENVDMGGTFVSVISSTTYAGAAAQGSPFAAGTSGMWRALDDPSGFSSALTVASGLALWPIGVTTSTNCMTWYSNGSVTTFVSGSNPISCL